jgi:hypothetical protein
MGVQAFVTSVKLLVELASLQTAFLTLDAAIKTTNRRVNALDNVVVPRLENTIAYIKVPPPPPPGPCDDKTLRIPPTRLILCLKEAPLDYQG